MTHITIIRAISPDVVCKTYSDGPDGLEKDVIANINEGEAVTVAVPDAAHMVRTLKKVTERADLVICPGVWHNASIGEKFRVLSEPELCKLVGGEIGQVPGGVLDHDGQRVSARLKRGIDYSAWMLLDADNPPGMPPEWACLPIAERLQLWEPFVPGIAACERIELRGSSARVHKEGTDPGEATHAWLRVSHPDKIGLLKMHIRVQMVLHGAAFAYEKKSRIKPDEVVGRENRSVFDLAVMDTGRLVFCAKPKVTAKGFDVADAGITLCNEGGGALDLSWVTEPQQRDLERLREKTGVAIRMSTDRGTISVISAGELTDDTEIEVKGTVKRLADWAASMSPGEKLRCEAPFRASQSEAAFIKMGDTGRPFVHDVGNGTTYKMQWTPDPEIHIRRSGILYRNAPQEDAKDSEPETDELPFWDAWVFLSRRAVFRNIRTGEECKAEAFNLAYGRDVPEMEVNGRLTRPTAAKYLMTWLDGARAYDCIYMPQAARQGPFIEHEGVSYVNSYTLPHGLKAAPDWIHNDAWMTCEAHIEKILPDDWQTVLKWMAHNVQNPGVKILWAPIIKGVQGDGKTTLARILGAAMGEHNVRFISPESLHSDFNGWAEGACVGALEEIRIKGHNRHDAMNKLKPVVTNAKIEVVRKGQDGRNIPNVTNYMAFTNHEDALVLDADDRRWGVFFTRFQSRQELVAETGPDYWRELNDAIADAATLRGWLMSIDLSGFDRNDAPPMTDAKRAMITASRPDDVVAVEEMISIGGYGVAENVVASDCLGDLIKQHGGFAPRPARIGAVMKEIGFERLERPFKWRNKTRRLYLRATEKSLFDDTLEARERLRHALDKTSEYDTDSDTDNVSRGPWS